VIDIVIHAILKSSVSRSLAILSRAAIQTVCATVVVLVGLMVHTIPALVAENEHQFEYDHHEDGNDDRDDDRLPNQDWRVECECVWVCFVVYSVVLGGVGMRGSGGGVKGIETDEVVVIEQSVDVYV